MSDELDFVPNPMDALSSIQPIPTKKTLMLVNNFIINTVDFINKFSALCEAKLAKISAHTQRLETQLLLLETKLESVPWDEDTTTQTTTTIAPSTSGENAVPISASASNARPPPPSADEAEASMQAIQPSSAVSTSVVSVPTTQPVATFTGPKLKDDPRFEKYFRMVRAGVPKHVVKLKIQSETQGEIDPEIIEQDPEGPAPPMDPSLAQAVVPTNTSEED